MTQNQQEHIKKLAKEIVKDGLSVSEKISWWVGADDTKAQLAKVAKKILEGDQ